MILLFFRIGLYLYVCIFQIQNPELLFEVQELLEVAMNERQSKMEAKQVLAQLQSNYDELQKKFAAAEITIDKLRYVYTFFIADMRIICNMHCTFFCKNFLIKRKAQKINTKNRKWIAFSLAKIK